MGQWSVVGCQLDETQKESLNQTRTAMIRQAERTVNYLDHGFMNDCHYENHLRLRMTWPNGTYL